MIYKEDIFTYDDIMQLNNFYKTLYNVYYTNKSLYRISPSLIKNKIGFTNILKKTSFPETYSFLPYALAIKRQLAKINRIITEINENLIIDDVLFKRFHSAEFYIENNVNIINNELIPSFNLQSPLRSQTFDFGQYYCFAPGAPVCMYFNNKDQNSSYQRVSSFDFVFFNDEKFYLKYNFQFLGLIVKYRNKNVKKIKNTIFKDALREPYNHMQGYTTFDIDDIIETITNYEY